MGLSTGGGGVGGRGEERGEERHGEKERGKERKGLGGRETYKVFYHHSHRPCNEK